MGKSQDKRNWIHGLLSLLIPGTGQFLQKRFALGIAQLVITIGLWVIFLGWVGHLWAAMDAFRWDPDKEHLTFGHP